MALEKRTLNCSYSKSESSFPSPSDCNMVSTFIHNEAALQSDMSTNKCPTGVFAASSRQMNQTNFNGTLKLRSYEKGQDKFKKDSEVFKKYNVATSKEEFDALPLNIQRRYLSTLERLKYVQSSQSRAVGNSHILDTFQNEDRFPKFNKTCTDQSAIYDQLSNAKPLYSCRKVPSLAERRGILLNHLNPKCIYTLEKLHEHSAQISTSSLLGSESPRRERSNSKTHNKDIRYRRSIILDTTGKVIERKSPIITSHHLSGEIYTPLTGDSMLSSHLGSVINVNFQSGLNNTNRKNSSVPDAYASLDWVEDDKDLNLDFSLNEYHEDVSLRSPNYSYKMKPSLRQGIPGNHPRTIMTPSPLSPKFKYLHPTDLISRSRADSLANSIKMTKTSISMTHNNALTAQGSIKSFKDKSGQEKSHTLVNTKLVQPTNSPKSIPISKKPENQIPTPNISFSTNNVKPQSSGATSDKGPNKQKYAINEKSDVQKRRSYTISSTRLPSFSIDSSHPGTSRPIIVKKIDSPLSSGNNQMTLRMTLTRPDLRADEAKIYAWQNSKFPHQNQYPVGEFSNKFEGKGPFGGPDGWILEEKEGNMVKKLWNKVTHHKSPIS
ncbi:hypothetical protein EV44_g5836 [Erysiphe necator]|uniref:Uncharacterized protein n=1 Tax=Uncinula necator TaxID=52586 RepID=A0A0B1PHS0_UNCNE|nr:hypothetical protein EV44_g5836 [Erysiphe necator]